MTSGMPQITQNVQFEATHALTSHRLRDMLLTMYPTLAFCLTDNHLGQVPDLQRVEKR